MSSRRGKGVHCVHKAHSKRRVEQPSDGGGVSLVFLRGDRFESGGGRSTLLAISRRQAP